MRAQSRKMSEGVWELGVNFRMQDRREAFLLEHSDTLLFIEEQAQFSDETNVCDCDVIADQELTVRQ